MCSQAGSFFIRQSKDYNAAQYKTYTEKNPPVYSDQDEWSMWHRIGDPVLHIELRDWADVLLIAPLSANTLGKISNGLCDNLVSCVVRAWNMQMKPLLVAPAMNTQMLNHPLTQQQMEKIKALGVHIIAPVSKVLACGETGNGALAPVHEIVTQLKRHLALLG